jgi:GntR family transcriptional regulator
MGAQGCSRARLVTGWHPRVPTFGVVTINPEADVPVYMQLAALIRDQIERGEIPERRAIPSKKQLMQQHGIAQGTVERALDVLKGEGLLRTVVGRGLFVIPVAERTGPD